ncbi:MAG: type II toxin-antitoxin system PemK/MazF family toxin [Acetobacteraceae bacterium]
MPEAGDIVWLQFDPQAGHEQAGHGPAVVLSPASYNGARDSCPRVRRQPGSKATPSRSCWPGHV